MSIFLVGYRLHSKIQYIYLFVLVIWSFSGYCEVLGEEIVEVNIMEGSGTSQENVIFTFGQIFQKDDMFPGNTLGAKLGDGSILPLQVDQRVLHENGSLRHAILTTRIPTLNANGTEKIILFTGGDLLGEHPISASEILNTDYDIIVSINLGGVIYTASARNLLSRKINQTWLNGPLSTEWHVSDALIDNNGSAHPHLTAFFYIRAYKDLQSIRTDVIIENNWTFQNNPQNFTYDVDVMVQGKDNVLSERNVTHYRQARWRRVFWWGKEPDIYIKQNTRYIMKTGAIPTYDSTLVVPDFRLNEMKNEFKSGDDLMEIGYMESYMPQGGGRPDIGPLPRWTARYLVSQDKRAKDVMLGFGEQAASWPIHYRYKTTNMPVSIDDFSNLTILGPENTFPSCRGSCNVPYEPDLAHQPSLNYVPYLVTGDYYHLEELHFWANWNLFYGEPSRHGYEQGLLSWAQVRGQAWGLRTLGHAAYITPEEHPLKTYFVEKLNNNIRYYNENWLDWNPLGYIVNQEWLELDQWIATWMDDFLTWVFGHLTALGFSDAEEFARYKTKFPVGRMTHPDMCWILASSYWPSIFTPYPVTRDSRPVHTWKEYHDTIIMSWNDDAFRGVEVNLSGKEQSLINASCNSSTMASILGLSRGEMIGYAWDPQGYPSNLQPALAVAAELGIENAEQAWNVFEGRSVKPTWAAGEGGGYDDHPQWAIVPRSMAGTQTNAELYSLTGNTENGTVVLYWNMTLNSGSNGFYIERKEKSSNFKSIAYINSKNITESENLYSFTDKSVEFSHKYVYRIKQIYSDGSYHYSSEFVITIQYPDKFKVFNAYPNPFNAETNIEFELSERTNITIIVIDSNGRILQTLVDDDIKEAGRHSIKFNAAQFSSGVYFYKIKTGKFRSKIGKLTLIK